MGNAQVMTAKAAWDNACYWAISALLYFQRRYRDPAFMASIDALMRRFFVLHARMQQLFRAWDLAETAQYADGFTNIMFMETLFQLQSALGAPRWKTTSCGGHSSGTTRSWSASRKPGRRRRVSPIPGFAASLHPRRWS